MTDTITLTGTVGTPPEYTITKDGLPITRFRLASNRRHYDKALDKWVESDANWYSVSAFRYLATNTFASIRKGDRIVLTGKLCIRPWKRGEKSGINVDVEADSLGHDLTWGTATFMRFTPAGSAAAAGGGAPGAQEPTSGQRDEDRWATPGADPFPVDRDTGEVAPGAPVEAEAGTTVEEEADAEVSAPF